MLGEKTMITKMQGPNQALANADPEEKSAQDFLHRIESIHELPTLSIVVLQLGRMLQDINTSAKDVTAVIEHDPSIVVKMLKLVNSAFFGFSNKVSSVQHALMLLGFNTVRNVILSIEVIDALKLRQKIVGFDIAAFWRHAIGVAVIGRHLDQATGGRHQEDVFTAGIIHDIGKIVMASHFSDQFQTTWDTMQRERLTFHEAECRHFPIDHAVIGEKLAARWHLPTTMQNVIGQHHTVSKSETTDSLVYIIHTADALHHMLLEENSSTDDWPICPGARHQLRQQIKSADQWITGLIPGIDEACQILTKET
jgi:HD-like signal output (HDOD) protein